MAGHGLEYHSLSFGRQFGGAAVEPPRPCVEQDDQVLRLEHTPLAERAGRRDRGPAFGGEVDPLEPAPLACLVIEARVAPRAAPAAALAEGAEHQPVAEGA